ncbi:hypothetical protein B0O80DRAFT_224562 [Mortierella sp. GBAus27b]|nr:hypothetical protein B0O80DRAFT_224562 [Mortierella sp. GBAus27b]
MPLFIQAIANSQEVCRLSITIFLRLFTVPLVTHPSSKCQRERPQSQPMRIRGAQSEPISMSGLLVELILSAVFGPRSCASRRHSVEYLVSMRHAPSLDTSRYVEYMKAQDSSMPLETISTTWNLLRDYFGQRDADDFKTLKDLMDVPALIKALRDAGPLDLYEPTADAAASPPSSISPAPLPPRSRSSMTSKRSKDGSNSKSSEALSNMRSEFLQNFSAFKGDPWELPSGTNVDKRIAESLHDQVHESTLHSFIIEDVADVIALFPSDEDQAALKAVVEERRGEQLETLSFSEATFLRLYDVSPGEMKNLLKSGWGTMGSTLSDLPDEDFRSLVHTCFDYIQRIYEMNHMSIPREESESWYMSKIWGFLNILFDGDTRLKHQPGEVLCDASAQRKNRTRRLDIKSALERKVDGLVLSSYTMQEICIIEAAKKDAGSTSTEALMDTLKMAKAMKDMHGEIRLKASRNIRSDLVTYGIRISGRSVTFYTLRQREGRFYQLCNEGTASFPAKWDSGGETTKLIISVLEWLFVFRKDMSIMARNFPTWACGSAGVKLSDRDHQAITLTTPVASPRLSPDTSTSCLTPSLLI